MYFTFPSPQHFSELIFNRRGLLETQIFFHKYKRRAYRTSGSFLSSERKYNNFWYLNSVSSFWKAAGGRRSFLRQNFKIAVYSVPHTSSFASFRCRCMLCMRGACEVTIKYIQTVQSFFELGIVFSTPCSCLVHHNTLPLVIMFNSTQS